MRSRIISWGLVVVGLGLTAAWCVLVLPALFVAEAGAGLTLRERGLIALPLIVGGALLIVGGSQARHPSENRGRAVALALVVMMIGILAALTAIVFLFMPA